MGCKNDAYVGCPNGYNYYKNQCCNYTWVVVIPVLTVMFLCCVTPFIISAVVRRRRMQKAIAYEKALA